MHKFFNPSLVRRIAWLTDIHLNFLRPAAREQFYSRVVEADADMILITGDIAEASDVCDVLEEFSQNVKKPIFFVLGNHDYYFGKVFDVRSAVSRLCKKNTNLCWLSEQDLIHLNKNIALVGQDGWADARNGDFDNGPVKISDCIKIDDLRESWCSQDVVVGKATTIRWDLLDKKSPEKGQLKSKMQELADIDANLLEKKLLHAVQFHPKEILIATHIPPFKESCWYKGQPSHKDYLPFFTSKVMGDRISSIAKRYPKIDFTVLCGHTHDRNEIEFLPNLKAKVGKAVYGEPSLETIIEIQDNEMGTEFTIALNNGLNFKPLFKMTSEGTFKRPSVSKLRNQVYNN